MRQLVGRVLRIGTEMFVFLVATLLVAADPVWAEQNKSEETLQISPEVLMDGNTDISVRCEIENQTETEVPELELQIRLPEGIYRSFCHERTGRGCCDGSAGFDGRWPV